MSNKCLEVQNLVVRFRTDRGVVTAVNGVNFAVEKGKSLGIVGESGSGKSVTALAIMGLIPRPAGIIGGGHIYFDGQDLLLIPPGQMRSIRGNRISMIFQEPMTSLNPVLPVGEQIEEVLRLHQQELNAQDRRNKVLEMLQLVGIPAPEKRISDYPHQLSGGMRQRIMIAMALACRPDILIADEPSTALDVTIQAQILDLMKKLQEELSMAIIMITHDLGVVAETCDQVAVMYCGKIVEHASVYDIFQNPLHPYTRGLLNSIPSYDSTAGKNKKRLTAIEGMVPSLFDLPPGCSFQNRCARASLHCRQDPTLKNMSKDPRSEHQVSCFHPYQ